MNVLIVGFFRVFVVFMCNRGGETYVVFFKFVWSWIIFGVMCSWRSIECVVLDFFVCLCGFIVMLSWRSFVSMRFFEN